MLENTKSHPGEFDALEKARPDELIFTLLERDPCAPPAIMHWCEMRRKAALEITDEEKRRAELYQITEAEFIAMSMLERQRGHAQPAEAAPTSTYSGLSVEKTAAEQILPKVRAELADAAYHLGNAAELLPQALEAGAISESQAGEIRAAARHSHTLSLKLSPHRAELLAESELPLDGGAS
jgi:hypothetical protein